MKKVKIMIAGIGGVGGYFGGLLAKHFYDNEQVRICFLARGEHLRAIRLNGLKVIKGNEEWIARPALATDNPSEIGTADFVIISTKSYDLDTVIQELRPCIHRDTIILPLLNGVDSSEKIKAVFPGNVILDGSAYIVSRLKQPGVIENTGNIEALYFGLDNGASERLLLLEKLFQEAGISATLSGSISTVIWEKFIFISPTATATSYFDKCIGELLSDKEGRIVLTALIEEIRQVAKAKHIAVPEDITEITLNKLEALPFDATSSMHSDFKAHKPKNESSSLTGYVLTEGQKHKLQMPMYLKTYEALSKRAIS